MTDSDLSATESWWLQIQQETPQLKYPETMHINVSEIQLKSGQGTGQTKEKKIP